MVWRKELAKVSSIDKAISDYYEDDTFLRNSNPWPSARLGLTHGHMIILARVCYPRIHCFDKKNREKIPVT